MELQLKNIGMIKEASVKIDGLTVIAGENDTGKSTVGKGFYLICQYSKYKDNPTQVLMNDIGKFSRYESLRKNIFKVPFLKNSDIKLDFQNRTLTYEEVHYHHKELPDIIDVLFIETPLVWNFTDFFRDIAQIESQFKLELDYPYLMKDLNFKLHIKSASNGLDIKKQMTDLMGGEFKKDEMGRYYFDKQGQRIELVNTATGIKYFGIFQVLSQNNYLNEDTVLILDEPEVHLHPKWQLEMAQIIVQLVKNGVKVLVNSHSPYMIEALEVYANKENIHRNFYLAQKQDDDSSIISDVTDNLEPIYAKLAEPIIRLEEESLKDFKW